MICDNKLLNDISTEKPLEKQIEKIDDKSEIIIDKSNITKKKEKKKKRCSECNKKMKHMVMTCKCSDRKFCMNCCRSENHNCTFDHVKEYRNKLAKENPSVNFSKINKL